MLANTINDKLFPLYQLNLQDSTWSIIFTSNGSHYYHNNQTQISKWVLDEVDPDEIHAQTQVDLIDRDSLLIVTARARGFVFDEVIEGKIAGFLNSNGKNPITSEELMGTEAVETINDETQNALDYLLGKSTNKDPLDTIHDSEVKELPLETSSESKDALKKPATQSSALVGGYSSSEDDDSSEEHEEEKEEETDALAPVIKEAEKQEHAITIQPFEQQTIHEQEESAAPDDSEDLSSSEAEDNGIDINDLMSDSDDEPNLEETQHQNQQHQNSLEEARDQFKALLTEAKLDPYSSWELESLNLVALDDQRFYLLTDNLMRQTVFDEWCAEEIRKGDIHTDLETNSEKDKVHTTEEDQEEEEEEEDDIIRYFNFLHERKNQNALCSFFKQFKSANQDQLSQFNLTSKEIETKYKEFLMYSKKSQDDLITMFNTFIKSSKVFKRNVQRNKLNLDIGSSTVDHADLEVKTARKTLNKLQTDIELSDSIITNSKYQVLPVVVRLHQLLKCIAELL
ncbi:hypothetical protein WICPIJ_004472 [Wickerhamomyces pijperi]|uniref:FF domain-containing protein n=1 Tax=Wickerhamomyces pijperi TaxID=599730 RepID=A0A9P8Q7R4_WICPI|nr:hypothetical protein WICPIJ_004472 [Wickerhamomyces pijperi]